MKKMDKPDVAGSFTPVTRKDFLRTAGSTALFVMLGIGFTGCKNVTDSSDPIPGESVKIEGDTITIDLGIESVAGLRSQGGWLLVAQANTLVVNVDGQNIRAFTSVCTHAGCATSWDFRNSEFICGCHSSRFNTSGRVTRGPAVTDLAEFQVNRNGNMVIITKRPLA